MKYIIFFIFIGLTKDSFAQKFVSGKIEDEYSKIPISYATVGIIKENIGVTTNKDGEFILKKLTENDDSLIVSCVGYKTKKIKISSEEKEYKITLQKEIITLDEVKINFINKPIILNDFADCSNYTFISNNTYFSQVAQLFEMPIKKQNLNKIIICTNGSNCNFRIHIFDYNDSLKCPGKELTDTSIILIAKKNKLKVDLKKYKIKIPDSKFFVSIEWLKLSSNVAQFKGEKGNNKSTSILYNPAISYENIYDEFEIKKDRIWILNFNGKWRNEIDFLKDKKFLITVVLN